MFFFLSQRASSAKSPVGSRRAAPSPPAQQLIPESVETPSPTMGKILETKAKYQEKLYTRVSRDVINSNLIGSRRHLWLCVSIDVDHFLCTEVRPIISGEY